MTHSTASLDYRRAATQHASVVGLVIALHDTLAGNIRRAADAIDRSDIQGRCSELVHAFKVLQQLETMLDMDKGGETAVKVKRFYSHVRGQLLVAQFKLSSTVLRDQIQGVLEVRGAWQQLDSSSMESQAEKSSEGGAVHRAAAYDLPAEPRLSFSCSL